MQYVRAHSVQSPFRGLIRSIFRDGRGLPWLAPAFLAIPNGHRGRPLREYWDPFRYHRRAPAGEGLARHNVYRVRCDWHARVRKRLPSPRVKCGRDPPADWDEAAVERLQPEREMSVAPCRPPKWQVPYPAP